MKIPERKNVKSRSTMLDAYIYDGIRSPIGRHAGKLAGLRPDDLAGEMIAEVVKRNGVKPEDISDVILGCVTQAGEDCRNVARFATLMAGLPPTVPGVTVNRLCASRPAGGDRRGARDHRGRRRPLHRRRRREHVARAVRDGQGGIALRARREDVRHHHRIPLHQPALQENVRRPGDARDRRQRGEGIRRLARAGRRIRARLAEEVRESGGGRFLQGRDPGNKNSKQETRRTAHHRRAGRAPAPRFDHGIAGQAEAAL